MGAAYDPHVPDVSVRRAWESLLPAGTRLLGGEAGLDRPVTWPVAMRTHAPAFDPLRGGELAIVPLDRLALLDESLTLARVVGQLARARVAAICAIGTVDAAATAAADRERLPLFELPAGSNAADVHQSFIQSLAEHRVELTRRIGEIGRELSGLAIAGRDRAAIVRRAGQIAETAAALLDDEGGPSYVYAPPTLSLQRAELEGLVRRIAPGTLGPNGTVHRAQLGERASALVAQLPGQRAAGWVALVGVGRELVDVDAAILEQAALACAIDVVREEASSTAREELLGDFLAELLRGEFASDESMVRRGRNLGYNLDRPHALLALVWPLAAAPDDPAEFVAATLENVALGVHTIEDGVLLLAPVDPPSGAAAADHRFAAALLAASRAGAVPSIGLGGVAAGPSALAAAAARASQALAIGRRIKPPGSVTAHEELGLRKVLFELRSAPVLHGFHAEMLGRLIDHDRKTAGELLRTLDAYLTCGCSPTAAAERLHLHRNGMLYRLQRIRELVPVDLDDPERRLDLHVALRAGDLLDAVHKPTGSKLGRSSSEARSSAKLGSRR